MPPLPSHVAALNDFVDAVERIRQDLLHVDTLEISHRNSDRIRAARIVSSSYVFLAASLERLLKESLRTSLIELTSRGVPSDRLRLSLLTLVAVPRFEAQNARRSLLRWEPRIGILEMTTSTDPAVFNADILPLDGKTPRAGHFETVWQVMGLPGTSLPGPVYRLALEDLADGRNEVAHGNVDPVTFGRSKAIVDVRRLLGRIEDIGGHLITALDGYFNGQHYSR